VHFYSFGALGALCGSRRAKEYTTAWSRVTCADCYAGHQADQREAGNTDA
jgi:hypothetical protein